jgi:glycosyltransferase involved in cell wall biosynthesis
MKISVIIPTWNRSGLISKAIISALNQTISPTEVLVCDDASTDDTYELVKSLNSPRVKWIPGKHSGLPAVVRNRGIKVSKGDWLAFLDSDDWWEKDKLERQIELIKKMQVAASCTNAYVINPHNCDRKRLYFAKKEVKSVIGLNELQTTNLVICSSFLVKKELVEICGGFPEEPKLKAVEDYALWLRLSIKTQFAYSPKPLVNYYNDKINSIRNSFQNADLQKKAVFWNFSKWSAKKYNKNQKQLSYIFNALMKNDSNTAAKMHALK